MTRNYLVAIGGTGSRCMEAVIYLAAAGLFKHPLHILIIDPDQNNGNSVRVRQLATAYHTLHLAQQPRRAQLKRLLYGGAQLPDPQLFQAPINRREGASPTQLPVFWDNPNSAQRKFGEVIEYQDQPEEMKQFLNLFYEAIDLEMVLDVGYRGRTNVGAVALKQDLEATANIKGGGLHEFLLDLNIDLQAEDVRVFVMGSVFGGTGAAGLPTIPALIKNLPDEVVAWNNRARLRFGCAMLTPYFSFPKGSSDTGPGTDSSRHAVATQAALLHYAQVPPGYQHAYLVGAPARPQTSSNNVIGGQNQANDPHYAELVAALAAWEFFSLDQVSAHEQELHFADSVHHQQHADLGLRWETLPVHPSKPFMRDEVKCSLVTFTTFAYFYTNFLHKAFIPGRGYRDATWYRNNFGHLPLDNQEDTLRVLNDFSVSYLHWLYRIGETGKHASPGLFNWEALPVQETQLCSQYVGNLAKDETSPRYMNLGYDKILERLDAIRLKQAETTSSPGLFIFLLHHAVSEFCHENYAWRVNGNR